MTHLRYFCVSPKIDNLNEEQLKKIAAFIASTEFIEWVSQLLQSGVSLSDEALSRDSIYQE